MCIRDRVNTDPALHMQSYAAQLRPELSGQLRRPTDSIPPMPLDNRKLIARRGALELRPDCLINLGKMCIRDSRKALQSCVSGTFRPAVRSVILDIQHRAPRPAQNMR